MDLFTRWPRPQEGQVPVVALGSSGPSSPGAQLRVFAYADAMSRLCSEEAEKLSATALIVTG